MNDWISVNDRLPEIKDNVWSDEVLIIVESINSWNGILSDKIRGIYIGYLAEDGWYTFELGESKAVNGGDFMSDHGRSMRYVTHWMPLPKMPEEVNDGQ